MERTKMIMEKFDYSEALKRLESIAVRVEDPQTGLEDIDKCIREADRLIEQCRAYLRTAREKTENLG